MKKQSMYMMMLAMSGLMGGMTARVDPVRVAISRDKICPKGCKKYFFNAKGEFSIEHKLSECIFECFAINDSNAIKKYKKHHESIVN